MYQVYTLSEVVAEIKDERARQFLSSLPYSMEIVSGMSFVDKKDLERVEAFAKETGDNKTLSDVDKLVIAVGLTLSREKEEF